MTSHVGRLYAIALALVVFFLTWAVVAAKPWASQSSDPRLAALVVREQRLRVQSALVQQVVSASWAAYRRDLARVHALNARPANLGARAPAVKVVTLPPLTVTRSS
jgi:hypothetical protein